MPQEGSRVHGCTGQPPGTDCFILPSYWPVSRCAFGREGVSPDLPLPGWEATGRHSRAGVGEELAEMLLSSGWSMWSG